MNRTAIVAIVLVAIAVVASPALAQHEDLTSLGQPGFYGRLELGDDSPRPEIYFSEPRLVEQVAEFEDSIYLRVRPGENQEWALHCHVYEACGRYVYFVNDDWYSAVYVPYYRDRGNPERPDGDFGHPDAADVAT
jgi:hypothetical protein